MRGHCWIMLCFYLKGLKFFRKREEHTVFSSRFTLTGTRTSLPDDFSPQIIIVYSCMREEVVAFVLVFSISRHKDVGGLKQGTQGAAWQV